MNIAIVTDTNSGILPGTLREPGLYLLPMPVLIDGEIYAEGTEITHRQLYEAMRQRRDISTSQPAPGLLTALWDGILSDGYDQIVHIPMSSGLSGSCFTARQMAEEYDGKVQVVDNHRISVTQKASFFEAQHLARQGYDAAAIKARLEAHAYDASIFITVDSLSYLKKGGRVTPAAAALATALNLKPVLKLQGQKLDTFAKVRGMRMAERKMIEAIHAEMETRFRQTDPALMQVETAGTFEQPEEAERWRSLVQAEFPAMSVSYAALPCSIACHVGMNACGIAVLKRDLP